MRTIVAALACLMCASTVLAAAPTTKPVDAKDAAAGQEEFVVTPMRVQEFAPRTYFHLTVQTSIAQIAPVVTEGMRRLHETMDDNRIKPAGAPMLIYKGVTQDVNKPFELQIGFPVAD